MRRVCLFICDRCFRRLPIFSGSLGAAPPTPPPPNPGQLLPGSIYCVAECVYCVAECAKPMSRHGNLYSDRRAAARYGLHVKCALGLSERRPLPTFACLMSERSDVDVFPAPHIHPPHPQTHPPQAQAPSLRKC